MRNRFIAFAVVISLFIPAFSILAQADTGGMVVITLEEAQTRALNNSLQYELQDVYISNALDDYYNAEDSYDKQSSTAAKSYIDYFNKPTNLEVSLQTAVNKVKSSRFQKEALKRTSDYNVLKTFINIKKAQFELEDAKRDAELKAAEYETAKGKFSMGIGTASSLRQSESTYKSAGEAATAALSKLQKEMQTLNRYLGRELTDYNILPVIDLKLIDINSINLDKVREDQIKNKESLYNLSMSAELAKTKYDLTKERYDEFVNRLKVDNSRQQMEEAFDAATLEYTNARKSFEDATIDLDMTLNTSYEALKTAVNSISAIKADIELAKEKAEIASLQYDMSLISKTEMNKAVSEVSTLQNKLNSSIADLNLQYASLMMYRE